MVEKIRALCKSRGITIRDLERTLGFGNATIRKWDENVPSVSKVRAVADYFGVSIDAIVSG